MHSGYADNMLNKQQPFVFIELGARSLTKSNIME